MSDIIRTDTEAGEYRIQNSEEFYAVWLPISSEEKEALFEKGKAESIDIPALAATVLRDCLLEAELSEDQLDQISGGPVVFPSTQPNLISVTGTCITWSVWSPVYGRWLAGKANC